MTRLKPINFLAGAAAVPLVALIVAGCGGGGGATAATAPAKTASGSAATIGVANTGLGKVLVDSKGQTIYLFQKDSGAKSSCSGACAASWPPVRATGKPVAGSGLNASLVGTTPRSDGAPQVTYNGHPLYLFSGDHKAGDTNGQGVNAFGASWFALSSSGTKASGSGPGSSSSGGPGGLGY